ncbi:MAG: nitroreductase family protein [Pyrinomonadaceae bacterium]
MGLQSRRFSPLKEAPGHARRAVAMTRHAKHLPNCHQYILNKQMPKLDRGALDLLQTDIVDSNGRVTLDELAAILMTTAGIRNLESKNNQVKRWAATAGNLGSVELFLAIHDVDGLPPGFYFYQPQEHSLAFIQWRSGMLEIEEFMRRVVLAEPDHLPDVLVLFTGAFERIAQKYGSFAYRLINLDAGAALSQFHLVARCLNIRSQTAVHWADDLIEEHLNLEPTEEHSTAVVGLFRSASTREPNSTRSELQFDIPPAKAAHAFCALPVEAVTEMLYRESRRKEDAFHLDSFGLLNPLSLPNPLVTSSEFPIAHRDQSVTALLPSPARGGRLVGEILASRTSIRHYTNDTVSKGQLSTMLSCAYQGDAQDWPEENHERLPLTFLVLAWRIDGLDPGVYAYDHQNNALCFSSVAPSSTEAVDLFVQREVASAPLVIWIVGNLAAACARHGAFGHRQLLLRAGAAGHRLWMASLGMGLEGLLVSGLVPGAARHLLGLDGYGKASLFAFVTGHGDQSFR